MAYQVTIKPAEVVLQTEEKESLLHASLRAGLNVNHGCANGSCGQCKVRILHGETSQIRHHDFILSEADKRADMLLMCCHSARSDIQLETSLASDSSDIPLQELTTRIRRIEHVDDNILRLYLRTPRSNTLRFMAGQHAVLKLNKKIQRELPIASCPCDGLNLEFHLHRESSDPFSDSIFDSAKKNKPIEIIGPCNGVTLIENEHSPLLFIAWGTGFAPIQSIIENCLSLNFQQEMVFHWVVHEYETHYADGYCRSVDDAIDNFHYHPIQTATAKEAIDKIIAWHNDFSQWRSYIIAPPAIIDNVVELLGAKGLPLEKVKSDPVVA